ncbi:MOSC domain-containing protein [Enterococcus faecalis]|nr:MOSC domain-containing protein [Enterococcus faecalis]EGO8273589.1 MOSC domain-containing protein [Enterococcus faecalis]
MQLFKKVGKNVGKNVGKTLVRKNSPKALIRIGFRDKKAKIGTRHIMGGVVVRKQNSLPRPPICYKFQIFFKNFPVLPLGKIASNF